MATIRERNGLFQVRVRRKGFPEISRSFPTKQLADTWAAQKEYEALSQGVLTTRSTVTFKDALAAYLGLKRDSRTTSIAKRALRDLGSYSLENLSAKVLCDWRDKLLSEGKASQTVRHHLGLVSVVFSKAIKRFHTYQGTNPARQIEMPSVANNGRTRIVTPAEVSRIVNGLSPALRAYVLLAYETGMRRGEIERIEKAHINPPSQTLLIPITKTGRPRTIPLSQDGLAWALTVADSGITGDYITRIFAERCKAEGITGARFHDLRHSAITKFFEKGLGHFEVATISGHTTMAMLQRYTHISPAHLAKRLYG
jgi:integrase